VRRCRPTPERTDSCANSYRALLNHLQQHLVDGMNTAAGSVHDTADSLRTVAGSYDTADSDAADRIRNTR
jgi:hypothetical protein